MPRSNQPPKDNRVIDSGIFYILRTGVPWRDLPATFGPWSSVYTRFRRCSRSGVFAQMLALVAKDAEGELRHIDCSHIKLHQDGTNPAGGQSLQAIGRAEGGINTKLAAIVDARGRPVALSLTTGHSGTTCTRSSRCCRACAGGMRSPKKALTQIRFVHGCVGNGPVSASHRSGRAAHS